MPQFSFRAVGQVGEASNDLGDELVNQNSQPVVPGTDKDIKTNRQRFVPGASRATRTRVVAG